MRPDMEKLDRAHRRLARGRADDTPVRALATVHLVLAVLVGIVMLAGVLIWVLLR
jgi:hypothetical protein